MTNYQNLYKERYGRLPVLNKFREKWAMQDVIDSVGFHKANDLLNYYFSLEKQDTHYNSFIITLIKWKMLE